MRDIVVVTKDPFPMAVSENSPQTPGPGLSFAEPSVLSLIPPLVGGFHLMVIASALRCMWALLFLPIRVNSVAFAITSSTLVVECLLLKKLSLLVNQIAQR